MHSLLNATDDTCRSFAPPPVGPWFLPPPRYLTTMCKSQLASQAAKQNSNDLLCCNAAVSAIYSAQLFIDV